MQTVKPILDVYQLNTNLAEQVTRANLTLMNEVAKACFNTSAAFVKILEENVRSESQKINK